MRRYLRSSFIVLAVSLLSTLAASAAPGTGTKPRPAANKSKIARSESLPATKADPAIAGRALLVKELPKSLTAADRKALDVVVAELRADRLESALVQFRAWAATPKHLLREEATNAAFWTFREGILARNEELANVVDRVRFFDERNAATDDSLALLKAAVITKKPVLVARMVVLGPYVKETRGDEKRERQIPRDALDAEIRELEIKGDEIRNERTAARAAFTALPPRTQQWMQVLAALLERANDIPLAPAKS